MQTVHALPLLRPLPRAVSSRLDKKLHLNTHHPIGITNKLLQDFLYNKFGISALIAPLNPEVSVKQAFDELLIPQNHPSRSPSDTFYTSETAVLRPQATCYQAQALADIRASVHNTATARVWSCDVFRRDEVDRTHFPVFHQMDGVKLFDKCAVSESEIATDLKSTLEEAILYLHQKANLSQPSRLKWISDVTFPFTAPSFELEVDGVELLGCGLVRSELLLPEECGWAFGVGLERLAMRLFGIHDIRIFWSEDDRIRSQFTPGTVSQYSPVNSVRFPSVHRDLSFWLEGSFEQNEFFEICRDSMEDWGTLESIHLVDKYCSALGRESLCFRLTYRALERTLTNEEVNRWHEQLTARVASGMPVKVR